VLPYHIRQSISDMDLTGVPIAFHPYSLINGKVGRVESSPASANPPIRQSASKPAKFIVNNTKVWLAGTSMRSQ
jgi:hypothetical protein